MAVIVVVALFCTTGKNSFFCEKDQNTKQRGAKPRARFMEAHRCDAVTKVCVTVCTQHGLYEGVNKTKKYPSSYVYGTIATKIASANFCEQNGIYFYSRVVYPKKTEIERIKDPSFHLCIRDETLVPERDKTIHLDTTIIQ